MHTSTIILPSNDFVDLNVATGIPVGTSIIVTNNTGSQLRLFQLNDTEPSRLDGFPVWPGQTCLVHGNDILPVLAKGGTDGRIVVQPLTSTVLPLTAVELPQDIVTSGVEGFRRLQVDIGQTGFFEAREFRLVRKIDLPTVGDSIIFKFTSPIDFILFEQDFAVSSGGYEFYAWRDIDLTEDTPFNTEVPFFNKNNSDNEYRDYDGGRYEPQVNITTGGSISVIDSDQYADYNLMKASNATSQRITVSSASNRQRYLRAGSYYLEFIALSNDTLGTYNIGWEERPSGTK